MSLAAGLIVALGIVGLSKDATQTFHEEMRSSVAEANLRTAVDRLRADLARAGYMSTGDVITDPMIARPPGLANPINSQMKGLARLSSILLNQGGSQANTPLSLGANGLNPDIIEIGGNMTTTDQYEVSVIQPAGGAGNCQQIFLNPQSPSILRIIGLGIASTQELNNIFQPTTGGVGQFGVRLTDKTGHTQFLATCPGTPTGFLNGQPYVLVEPQTPVLMGSQTGTVGGLNGYGTGALVNPVQIVHWEIEPATKEQVQYQGSPLAGTSLAPTTVDPLKYDLVRSYVDMATGAAHRRDGGGRGRVRGGPRVCVLGRHGHVVPAADHHDVSVRQRGQRALGPEPRDQPAAAQSGAGAHPLGARAPRDANGRRGSHAQRRRAEPHPAFHVPVLPRPGGLQRGEHRRGPAVRARANGDRRGRAPEPVEELLLMNALALAKRRAALRRREDGAAMFIVAMTLAVLASVGVYALAAAATEVKTSGNERQNTQTHYLSQYGVLGVAHEMTGG